MLFRPIALQRIALYYVSWEFIEMGKSTITFRLETAKREALDTIAEINDRNRSYVLNEAIEAYLDIHEWQVEHIKKGLRQAQSGQFASAREVRKAFARWRR